MTYQVNTGRRRGRTRDVCPSCAARMTYGNPRPTDTWPAQLRLTERDVDLLLVAAAEFRDLCEEAGEYEDVVAFVDWLRPEALNEGSIVAELVRGELRRQA